jgi:inner membrane protein
MFVIHLPAGYLVSRLIGPRTGFSGFSEHSCINAGMVGAIAPDLEQLYFYLIDHRQHNHHSYWTHYPSLWLGLLLIVLVLRYPMGWSRLGSMALMFSLNGLIHMALDSVAGFIYWLAPLQYKACS